MLEILARFSIEKFGDCVQEMKKIRAKLRSALLMGMVCVSSVTGAWAEESLEEFETTEEVVEEIKEAMKADKTGTNPLNFTFDARLYNEYMWLNTEGDGHQNITTAEFRAPFAGGKWQFRGKVRYVDLEADLNDNGIDDLDDNGWGDTDLRFMTIPYLKRFGVATGVEFFLDTASEDVLGTGTDIVAPFIFLGLFNPLGPGSLLVPGYQHKVSFDEEKGRDRVRQGAQHLCHAFLWCGHAPTLRLFI